jgi:hypothetical protein
MGGVADSLHQRSGKASVRGARAGDKTVVWRGESRGSLWRSHAGAGLRSPMLSGAQHRGSARRACLADGVCDFGPPPPPTLGAGET